MHNWLHACRHLLGYSQLTTVLIGLLMVAFQVLLIQSHSSGVLDQQIKSQLFMMTTLVCCFTALSLGSALRVFRSHFLWRVNVSYRRHLGAATLSILLLLNISFTWPLLYNITLVDYVFFLPVCVGICCLYFNFAQHYAERLLWPSCPAILYVLSTFDINERYLASVLIIIAAVLAVRLFAHSHYANINTFEESDTSANSDVIWEDMHLKLKALVGRWVITKIGSSKKDISWAITSPLNRMGVLTLAHGAAFTVLLALLPFSADISHETVMYIFLAISPLAMLLDVRKNTPQLRGLAHHYGADGMFKSLQVNILFGYYKLMLKDTCLLSAIMISTIILCGYLFDVTMLFFIFAVQLTALLWAPALLLCRWDRVNLALVAGVIAYLSSLLSAHHLISLTQSSDNNAALLGAIVCLAFTVISGCQVYMYKQSHLERLLR